MLKKPKQVTITRKIELKINVTDIAERSSIYDKLRRWRTICTEGANEIVSHLFYQLRRDRMVYLSESAKIHEDNKELDEKEIIKLVKDQKKEIYKIMNDQSRLSLNTSPQNTCYKVLSAVYKGQIPSSILTALAQNVFKNFTAEKSDLLLGKRSLRNYKQDMPIPVRAPDMTKVRISTLMEKIYDKETGELKEEKVKVFKDVAFSLYGIPFRTFFGKDKSDNEYYLKSALSAHFLPDIVWKHEPQLAENILHSKKARWTVKLGELQYHISLEVDKQGVERFYQVITAYNDSNVSFKMMRDERSEAGEKEKKNASYKIVSDMFLADSSIVIEKRQMKNAKDGRKEATNIYLLTVIQFEKEQLAPDKNKVAYCYLDMQVPIRVVINDKEYSIGNVDALQHRRRSIQEQTRALQRALADTRSRYGRRDKMKTLEKYKKAESNYFSGKAHLYSKKLVDLCLLQRVGMVVLKDMSEAIEEAKEDKKILRNWGYQGLSVKIAYKLDKQGIAFVDESKPVEETE